MKNSRPVPSQRVPSSSHQAQPTPAGGSAISDPYQHAPVAKAQAKEEHGTSADALYAMRTVRRELGRAMLVDDASAGGSVGSSYVVWAQLRALLAYALSLKSEATGLRAPAPSDYEVGVATTAVTLARERVDEQPAHATWTAAVKAMAAERFITEPDHDDAFLAFLHAPARARAEAGAVLAGLLLERSAATPGYDFAAHRAIAHCVRGTDWQSLRDIWTPTPEFLAMLPKAQQLAIAKPFLDEGTFGRWEKLKAADVPIRLAQALAGAGHDVPGRFRDAARAWVHPLLAFTPPEDEGDADDPGPANDADVELAEAAE